jgi:hypothetical protein
MSTFTRTLFLVALALVSCTVEQKRRIYPTLPVGGDCLQVMASCTDYYGDQFVDIVRDASHQWAENGDRNPQIYTDQYCPFRIHCVDAADGDFLDLPRGYNGLASLTKILIRKSKGAVIGRDATCRWPQWRLETVVLHELGHFSGYALGNQHPPAGIMKATLSCEQDLALP